MDNIHKKLFDNSLDAKMVVNGHKIIDCNQEALNVLGYRNKEDLVSHSLTKIILSSHLPSVEKLKENKNKLYELKAIKKNKQIISIWVKVFYLKEGENELFYIQKYEDNEWDRLEETNIFQGAILRTVIDANQSLIYSKNYCSGDGVYIGCNRAFREFYGLTDEEIIGNNDINLFGEKQGSEFRSRDQQVIDGKSDKACDEWIVRTDGTKALLQTHKTILRDYDGHIIGILSISRDITLEHDRVVELEESERNYKEMANSDPLTGIPNRRLFFELAKKIFIETIANNKKLSLIMIDVDGFKMINDTYGHVAGDKVLKHIVDKFKVKLRKYDLLARYAGDEFVVLLPDTNAEDAMRVAKKLRDSIVDDSYATSDNEIVPISISVGVGTHDDESICEEILVNADKALYRAKKKGRGQIMAYDHELD